METPERRYLPVKELRAMTDEQGVKHLVGYAALFDTLSEDLCGFREKIAPGCFSRSCKEGDVRALRNHNSDYVIGRTRSGTLSLMEDERGLKMDCIPPDAQWARDLMASIDRGDVDQMSFGFRTITDSWSMQDGVDVRTLMEVELFDVSPVTYPAYPDTSIAVRSMETWRKENTEPEKPGPDHTIGIMQRKLKLKEKLTEAVR